MGAAAGVGVGEGGGGGGGGGEGIILDDFRARLRCAAKVSIMFYMVLGAGAWIESTINMVVVRI